MIFLTPLEQRILIVSIVQCWPILYDFFFMYKLLKRSKNITILSLCSCFLFHMIGLTILIFSIFTANTPLSYPLFVSGYYNFFYSYSFLIIFSWLLLRVEEKIPYRAISLMAIFYAVSFFFIMWIGVVYGGIEYGVSTGWVPVFKFNFAIMSWIYIILLYYLPEIVIAVKLTKFFNKSSIKKRIILTFVSIFLGFLVLVFTILYNFWVDNPFYRGLHTFINLPLGTISAYLIYRSIGKTLS